MQNAESVGLHKDHVGIAKFDDLDDPDFKIVSSHLLEMANAAPAKIAENWQRYEKHEGV